MINFKKILKIKTLTIVWNLLDTIENFIFPNKTNPYDPLRVFISEHISKKIDTMFTFTTFKDIKIKNVNKSNYYIEQYYYSVDKNNNNIKFHVIVLDNFDVSISSTVNNTSKSIESLYRFTLQIL